MFRRKLSFVHLLFFLLPRAALSGCAGPQPLPPKKSEALELDRKGAEYFHRGQYEKALKFFQKALQVQESVDDRQGVALCLNHLGTVHQALSDYSLATQYYERSLAIHLQTGDEAGQSLIFNNLGGVKRLEGKPEAALELFRKSLAIEEKREIAKDRQSAGTISGWPIPISEIKTGPWNITGRRRSFTKRRKTFRGWLMSGTTSVRSMSFRKIGPGPWKLIKTA